MEKYIHKLNRNYKDTVFRAIFSDKTKLLELYNALNDTKYSDTDDLKINTLEDVVYIGYKNDISFVLNYYINLYEHQSTLSPNMPLRDLFYVARLLEKEVKHDKIYSTTMLKIKVPRFVVFYNGTDQSVPERCQYKLSDLYEIQQDDPQLELVVTMININKGKNKKLMQACKTLEEYSIFVDMVRERTYKLKEQQEVDYVEKGVTLAVEECISNNILREFLINNKVEVISMFITEWNEEEYLRVQKEESREEGIREGIEQGEDNERIRLIRKYLDNNKTKEEIADILFLSIEEVQSYIDSMDVKD